jgi:hypothetical protein
MYFGMSLGRTGLDFRQMVVPIFENAIYDRISVMICQAHEVFKESPQQSSRNDGTLLTYPALAQLYNRYMHAFNVFNCLNVAIESLCSIGDQKTFDGVV